MMPTRGIRSWSLIRPSCIELLCRSRPPPLLIASLQTQTERQGRATRIRQSFPCASVLYCRSFGHQLQLKSRGGGREGQGRVEREECNDECRRDWAEWCLLVGFGSRIRIMAVTVKVRRIFPWLQRRFINNVLLIVSSFWWETQFSNYRRFAVLVAVTAFGSTKSCFYGSTIFTVEDLRPWTQSRPARKADQTFAFFLFPSINLKQ